MSKRNLFESFNLTNKSCSSLINAEIHFIDLVDEDEFIENDVNMIDCLSFKKELQTIDVFSNDELNGLQEFKVNQVKVENIDSVDSDSIEMNDDYLPIKIVSHETVKESHEPSKNMLWKSENRLPSLLITKMEEIWNLEPENSDPDVDFKPPLQIEIETGLPDLRKSDIITKQDLIRIAAKKPKLVAKEEIGKGRKSVKRKLSPIDICFEKKIETNFENRKLWADVGKKQDVFNDSNKTTLRVYAIKLLNEKIQHYHLLSDISNIVGLGIVDFVCRYFKKIDFLEIPLTEFLSSCQDPSPLPELPITNHYSENIISLIEINDSFKALFLTDFCDHKSNFLSSTGIHKDITIEENGNFEKQSLRVEQSRRKQVFVPITEKPKDLEQQLVTLTHKIKCLGMLHNLEVLSEQCIKNVTKQGGRVIVEQFENLAPFQNYVLPKKVNYLSVVCEIKGCIWQICDKTVEFCDHIVSRFQIPNGNGCFSQIIKTIDPISIKLMEHKSEINNWMCLHSRLDFSSEFRHITLYKKAMRLTMCAYRNLETIREFSRTTHQLLVES